MTLVIAESSAVFSSGRRYRYSLSRRFAEGPTVVFVGLNPSTADEYQDDPTIRRCIGFAKRWGYGEMVMANLYALRSTDPRGLWADDRPDGGAEHDEHLRYLAHDADLVVCAWGANPGPDPHRAEHVLRVLSAALPDRARVIALALTRGGQPRHPLYVRSDVEPVPYPPEAS